MAVSKSYLGQTNGMLTVVSEKSGTKENRYRKTLTVQCACGVVKNVRADHFAQKVIASCGCRQGWHKHEKSYDRIYKIWSAMKSRCYYVKNQRYADYGGRGIKVCDRWRDSFENFYRDMGDRPSEQHSIDRIDVDGDYEPSNCRWADKKTQSRNQRLKKTNKTGISGVTFYLKKWDVRLDGKYYGRFDDFFEACCVRKSAELLRSETGSIEVKDICP